ncbi:MAG: mechanosensitive ion channel family protein [Candidatus Omnitrophica bacterium]|nr:mechanosensitive ion channel family protein [Candidatus Omnitrophota bacterium]MBU1871616.1 mechanosensitive ion channel family protein [Candidatus Omnitrophota bacterium]
MSGQILQAVYFNNRVLDYFNCLAIFLGGVIIISLFRIIILRRMKRLVKKTDTTLDDFLVRIISKNVIPLLYFGALYISIRNLTLSAALSRTVNISGLVLITIFSIRFFVALLSYILQVYAMGQEGDESRQRSIKGILAIIKVIVWGLGIVFLLDNLGFKISTVIAGLGIGGVAVALAAQAVLGDLFSYFSIFFDRPFEIGDFIIVGDFLGTIEHIGIKTTRIRSLGGEQIVFSNTDLTNSRVRNYKRMDKRRVVFNLGVTYQTALKEVQEIPVLIKGIIENIEDTVFDRAHFFSFGDFNLIFEVVYYVLSRDYNKYMDIQQEINFAIKNEFEKRGIEFAYPTQTLHIEK